MEKELVAAMQSDLELDRSDNSDKTNTETVVRERDTTSRSIFPVQVVTASGTPVTEEKPPASQETMLNEQVYGLTDEDSNLKAEAGSSKMDGTDSAHTIQEEYEDMRCPIVWDWTRLYGTTADIHTVTWESDMLSSLCHIVGE
jgi:hypothetical protein